MTTGEQDYLDNVESLKCMVIGDAAVGKTCMLISYSNNEFPKEHNPTVFDNYTANVVFKGKTVALGLWDTAGSEEYDQLRPLSYPDTHIFVIVFAINSETSLLNVEKKWVPEVRQHTDGIPFIVVGNKSDLRNDESMKDKIIPTEESRKLAERVGASHYMECSAKTQENLREVFDKCIQVVYDHYQANTKKKNKKKECLIS